MWTAELSAKKYFIAYFTTPESDIGLAGEIATAIDSTNDCIPAAADILPRQRKNRRIRLSVKNEWNSLHNVHSGRQTDDSVAYVHSVYDRNWSPNNKQSTVHSPRWCATIWKSILCLLTSRQMGAKHRGALERADECTWRYTYTVNHKKGDSTFVTITWENLDRFFIIFALM